MDGTNTFDLEDLNDDFWGRVVYFETHHSSGMGGSGCVWFVTSDGKKYYLGFEDLPFSEYDLDEHFPFFKRTGEYENGHFPYEIESEGWHYLSGEDALVRDDVWPAFQKVISDKKLVMEKVSFGFLNIPDIVGLALGAGELERVNYIRSVIWQENFDREMEEIRAEHERNKLTEEHFKWKPIYPNNMKGNGQEGWYAMLFTQKEGRIRGVKFSIVFQRKEISPMCTMQGDRGVQRYNLFIMEYKDVVGPLCHPPCEGAWTVEALLGEMLGDHKNNMHWAAFYEWITLGDGEVNDYGEFRRSFRRLQEAKEYAMCIANANPHIYGDRNTVIKDTWDVARDHRLRVEKYEAYMAYRKYYREILDAVCSFDGYESDGSGGSRFIFDAVLASVPEITERQLSLIWHEIPLVLEGRTQRCIEMERQNSLAFLERYFLKMGE